MKDFWKSVPRAKLRSKCRRDPGTEGFVACWLVRLTNGYQAHSPLQSPANDFANSKDARAHTNRTTKMRRAILMDTEEGLEVAFQLKILIKKATIKFSSIISQKILSRQKNGNSDFNGYRGGSQIFIPSAIRRKILPTSYELCFGIKKWSAISRSCLVGRLNDFGQVCRL